MKKFDKVIVQNGNDCAEMMSSNSHILKKYFTIKTLEQIATEMTMEKVATEKNDEPLAEEGIFQSMMCTDGDSKSKKVTNICKMIHTK